MQEALEDALVPDARLLAVHSAPPLQACLTCLRCGQPLLPTAQTQQVLPASPLEELQIDGASWQVLLVCLRRQQQSSRVRAELPAYLLHDVGDVRLLR